MLEWQVVRNLWDQTLLTGIRSTENVTTVPWPLKICLQKYWGKNVNEGTVQLNRPPDPPASLLTGDMEGGGGRGTKIYSFFVKKKFFLLGALWFHMSTKPLLLINSRRLNQWSTEHIWNTIKVISINSKKSKTKFKFPERSWHCCQCRHPTRLKPLACLYFKWSGLRRIYIR